MIALNTHTFDLRGYLQLKIAPSTTFGTLSRRSSRTATLDGGSVVSDLGFSYTDSLFNIVLENVSNDDLEDLAYMVQTYPIIIMSTKDGVFEGILSNLNCRLSPIQFTFSPTKQLV